MVRAAPSLFSSLLVAALAGLYASAAASSPSTTSSSSTAPPLPPSPPRDCIGVNAIHPACAPIDPPYRRDVFYIGGRLVPDAVGNLTIGQLYVEKLTPADGPSQPNPLVFFHGGGGFTAGTWLNTPDNRRGFAAWFLQQGYQVYLVDQAALGRSSSNDLVSFPSLNPGAGPELVEAGFTAVQDYLTYPQAINHTQWPGTGRKGDPAFDQFAQAIIPSGNNRTAVETVMRTSGCQLLSLIGPAYLIQHSYGGHWGILMSNDCGENVAGSINLESSTVPFWWYNMGLGGTPQRPWGLTETRIDYDPPVSSPSELQIISVGNETTARRNCYMQKEPARKLPKVAAVPYLLLTAEASVHITFAHCIDAYMRQVGAEPEWIKLADLGIHGNGHFMYLEKNGDDIAEVVHSWVQGQLSRY